MMKATCLRHLLFFVDGLEELCERFCWLHKIASLEILRLEVPQVEKLSDFRLLKCLMEKTQALDI